MNTPEIHFVYATIEKAAKTVSEGTAFFSSEQLAGWYAYDAAKENLSAMNRENFEVHLDVLIGEGAKFDYAAAIEAAIEYAAAE